jgi:hypothetical protein
VRLLPGVATLGGEGLLLIAGADLVRAGVEDLVGGTDRSVVAARFHNGVAGLITDCCLRLRERHGLSTVALSGGVFQNLLLLNAAVGQLEAHGFRVLTHTRVPCNDGGSALARRSWPPQPTGPGNPRGRCLIPAASRSTTSAMRAARTSGRRLVPSIQRRYALR